MAGLDDKLDRPRTPREWLESLTYPVNRLFLPYQSINAGTLKIIAAVTMFIDHLAFAFLEIPAPGKSRLLDTLPYGVLLDSVARAVGRTAMPIFAFLIVEGYVHTRSRGRYLMRLLLFALLSWYPFKELFYPYDKAMHCDTLFTLALGLVAVWTVDVVLMEYLGLGSRRRSGTHAAGQRGGQRDDTVSADIVPMAEDPLVMRVTQIIVRLGIAVAVTVLCCVVATRIGADYRYGGVLLVMILYLFRQLRIAGVTLGYLWFTWYNANEIYAFVGMTLVQCYNGERGRQFKYLFYVFYPGHLFLILILRRWLLGF